MPAHPRADPGRNGARSSVSKSSVQRLRWSRLKTISWLFASQVGTLGIDAWRRDDLGLVSTFHRQQHQATVPTVEMTGKQQFPSIWRKARPSPFVPKLANGTRVVSLTGQRHENELPGRHDADEPKINGDPTR